MRVLTAALVGNPLPEHIKVTVFMDGMRVGPVSTQLFRLHANTMSEAIQIAVYSFRILIDLGASKDFARRQSVARNADKFADALRENSGTGPISVRLANGSLVEVPRVLMDLPVKFEGFYSTERFIVLGMDNYDLILGMPLLEKHEPWIDWRGKAIGASRPALSDRALVRHVPTSVKTKGIRQDRQGTSAPEEFMGVAEVFGVPQELTVDSVKESAEALPGVKPSEPREASRSGWASCVACGATKSVDPDTGSRRANAWEAGDTASNVGNLVPREPVKAKQEGKVGEDASCLGNIAPHKASMADDARDEASSDMGNIVPRRGRRRRCLHRKSSLRSQNGVAQGDSEPKAKAPQTRWSEGHYHVFDSETGLRVKANAVQLEGLPEVTELLNLEGMSLDEFLADLKAGEIAEMVLLRPEPTPEELNSFSVITVSQGNGPCRESSVRSSIPWLGLANYLHKYSAGYAGLAKPLSDLLKKDADWRWERQHEEAFDSINASLQRAPILALPDESKRFRVVCGASEYAIGCALLQTDEDGHERTISFQSRQLKAVERNYPVHDKELLAVKYAFVKFWVHLLGSRPFVVYTDHAPLRTVTNSPHLSQRMARWLSSFPEYNFRVEYKPYSPVGLLEVDESRLCLRSSGR
ncbi:unnamed protein product [Phytophthora fragariaefolia]|uniref:Unnamed protein product n=1 Tax=Phytophthora fragariaefolia TaxID=1490495 RepID=A0A9W6YQW9_9STRA|nr:unnamed protein product [Phytophthora fragariaefolia]